MKSLKKDARRLKSVSPEYRASVYAKMDLEKRNQQDTKSKELLASLRATLKELKGKLREAYTESDQVDLTNKIFACEKAIKKSPKPTRKWSLTLSGSFELGKKR